VDQPAKKSRVAPWKKGPFSERIKARKAFNEEKRRQLKADAKMGTFTPGAQFHKSWMHRKPLVPPAKLQKAFEADKELQELERTLAISFQERKKQASAAVLEPKRSILQKRLEALNQEVQPLLDKLMEFDTKVRKVRGEIEFLEWWSKRVSTTPDRVLKSKIQARKKQIERNQSHSILARQQLELRKIRGNWTKRVI